MREIGELTPGVGEHQVMLENSWRRIVMHAVE